MAKRLTQEQKEKINFLYWETACCPEMIARRMGISGPTVHQHIGKRPTSEHQPPRPTQHGQNFNS